MCRRRQIKRPYFHVVPLDRRQLRAWRDYLQLEASDGDHHSLVLLYERCLIACAQYEEFWGQYARYLERRLDAAAEPAAEAEAEQQQQLPPADPAAGVREVYKRACLVHCPTKPSIRLQWAAFEESRGETVPAGSHPALLQPQSLVLCMDTVSNHCSKTPQ